MLQIHNDIQNGFNLLELLFVLVLIGVLASLAIPNLNAWVERERGKQALEQLSHVIYYARSEAIKRNAQVIICASIDHLHCAQDWSAGYMVAISSDGEQPDSSQAILRIYPGTKGMLVWRATHPEKPLTFLPTGFTHYQMGSFYYCGLSEKEKPAIASRLIINQNGRPRIAGEQDGTLSCSELS